MKRAMMILAALAFAVSPAIANDGGGSGGGGGGGSGGGGSSSSGGGGGGSLGGGSSGGGNSGGGGTADTQCYNGKVYDKRKRICVKPQARLDDESLIDHAYMLARTGEPNRALQFLDRVVDRSAPRYLNIKGFATRKAGDVDQGIVYYKQALLIDNDNALVREYLGEAYVTKGDLDLARAELNEIRRICGNDECEQYQDLANAILGAGGAI